MKSEGIRIEVAGTVYRVISDEKKIILVVRTGTDFREQPIYIPVEFFGKNKANAEGIGENESVVCGGCEVQGREWNNKFFVTIKGWKVKKIGAQQPADRAMEQDQRPTANEPLPLDDEQLAF
jgi:hypothetical protein